MEDADYVTFNQEDADAATLASIERMAKALAAFGTLEKISFGYGERVPLETFMAHIGRQPQLTDLFVFSRHFSYKAGEGLAGFPALRILIIHGNEFTGHGLPALPRLEVCELSYTKVTPEVLRRVACGPSLVHLTLVDYLGDTAAIRAMIKDLQAHNPRLEVFGQDEPLQPAGTNP